MRENGTCYFKRHFNQVCSGESQLQEKKLRLNVVLKFLFLKAELSCKHSTWEPQVGFYFILITVTALWQ
jgi:hypothetical protein